MPIFEYECQECHNRFEELMRRSDPDPACPSCGDRKVRRLISHTSFQLKGSGWYATDYASKSRSSSRPSEKSSSSSDAKSSSSSTDKTKTKASKKKASTGDAVAA